MLEILLIIVLAKKIGSMVSEKGHNPLPFQAIFVVAWVGGEIAGAIVGAVLVGAVSGKEPDFCSVYVGALFGAFLGAGASFLLAALIPAQRGARGYMDDYNDYRDGKSGTRRRRRSREDEDEEDDRPRRRPRSRDDEDEDDRPRRRNREEDEDRDRRRRPDDRYRE